MNTQTAPRPEGNFFPAHQCRAPTTSAPMPSRNQALQCREIPNPQCQVPRPRRQCRAPHFNAELVWDAEATQCRGEQGIRHSYIYINISIGDVQLFPVEDKALGTRQNFIYSSLSKGGHALFPDTALGIRREKKCRKLHPPLEELDSKNQCIYT
jgi:hypothetical protein